MATHLLSSVTNLRVLHSILRPRLCTTGSALSPPKMFANWGRKSRARVAVVEARIKAVIVTKAKVARSDIRLASTTTMPDVITTKYTLIPMYCESFRAGIFTCLKPLMSFRSCTLYTYVQCELLFNNNRHRFNCSRHNLNIADSISL